MPQNEAVLFGLCMYKFLPRNLPFTGEGLSLAKLQVTNGADQFGRLTTSIRLKGLVPAMCKKIPCCLDRALSRVWVKGRFKDSLMIKQQEQRTTRKTWRLAYVVICNFPEKMSFPCFPTKTKRNNATSSPACRRGCVLFVQALVTMAVITGGQQL